MTSPCPDEEIADPEMLECMRMVGCEFKRERPTLIVIVKNTGLEVG
jgi:hypothetical protein